MVAGVVATMVPSSLWKNQTKTCASCVQGASASQQIYGVGMVFISTLWTSNRRLREVKAFA